MLLMVGLLAYHRGCVTFLTVLTLVLLSLSLGQCSRTLSDKGSMPECTDPPRLDLNARNGQQYCMEFDQVCMDQGIFILHDQKVLADKALKDLKRFTQKEGVHSNVQDFNRYANIRGPADPVYAQFFSEQLPRARLATAEEYEEAKGKFSECTVPVVFNADWYDNYAEFTGKLPSWLEYMSTRAMNGLEQGPAWNNNLTIVLGMLHNMPMLGYHRLMLEPYSKYEALSIQDLSSRLPEQTPSRSTYEGTHVRCFKKVYVCVFPHLNFAWTLDVGRRVLDQNRATLKTEAMQQAVQEVYKKPGQNMLHILFEVRTGSTGTRVILNVDSLIEECNAHDWTDMLQSGGYNWTGVECAKHVFGDFHRDMAVMQATTIFITCHGAGEMNSIFMKPDPILIELRANKAAWWVNMWWPEISHLSRRYMRAFIVSIAGEGLWEPGIFEKLAVETQDPERLQSETYANENIKYRDRNVYLKMPMLLYSVQRALNTSKLSQREYVEEYGKLKGHNWRFADNMTVEEYNLW